MPSRYERLRQQLEQARAHLAELENRAAENDSERQTLADLPSKHGFDNLEDFLYAVRFSIEKEKEEANPRAAKKEKKVPVISAPGMAAAKAKASGDGDAESSAGGSTAVQSHADQSAPPSSASAPSAESSADSTTATAAPLPTGTSLSDPVNFGQMPDLTLVENGLPESLLLRDQLRQSLEFARQVLHTSRVPAAVWRAWREFERRGTEIFKQTR